MSKNAALLGGILIGGLAVGAAMAADDAHHHRRGSRGRGRGHHHHHHHHQKKNVYCICGAQMMEGQVQKGSPHCNRCNRFLCNSRLYYCPQGGNVHHHPNGFFLCQQCSSQPHGCHSHQTVKVVTVPQVQPQPVYHSKPQTIVKNPSVNQSKPNGPHVVKQGYMSKKGNWLNTAFKKRWFKLWSNKKMAYFTEPNADYTKGYADFTRITKIEKISKHGFEVTTPERVWSFLCSSELDRNDWVNSIQSVCLLGQSQINVHAKPMQQQQPQVQPQQMPQPSAPPVMQQNNNNNNNNNNIYNNVPAYNGVYPQLYQQQPQQSQPGMVGYNYASPQQQQQQQQQWQNNNNNDMPPPAYSDVMAPSAPPEEEEGAVTNNYYQ